MGNTLKRHPFSGLVHSAGELLHRGRAIAAVAFPVRCVSQGIRTVDHPIVCYRHSLPATRGTYHYALRNFSCPLNSRRLFAEAVSTILESFKSTERPIAFSL